MAGDAGRISLRRRSRVRMAVLIVCGLGVVLVVGFLAELALADYVSISNRNISVSQRVAAVLNNGDHLHYSLHLAAGRLLDVCPCTHNAADTQYWRASFHARSERQLERVTNQRPTTPAARAADTLDLAVWSVGWTVGEIARLSAPLFTTQLAV